MIHMNVFDLAVSIINLCDPIHLNVILQNIWRRKGIDELINIIYHYVPYITTVHLLVESYPKKNQKNQKKWSELWTANMTQNCEAPHRGERVGQSHTKL